MEIIHMGQGAAGSNSYTAKYLYAYTCFIKPV